ncbi:hypothetical protein [Clostridium sp. 'White wine YQ']|uniref:hypothetical protein n=1 Tax=Clostridium sp. 'White wine YQ' TaxID=3027474 RepID=UPI0023652764|nr:hypothetical protein [Clostridium sp. 'White wine YQ']MDD7793218.1 hypothetical protein [Clostridium sp. 'White wine YQ']
MKTKKYVIYFLLIILLFVCSVEVGLKTTVGSNILSRYEWTQKKKQLENTEISKITFYTGGRNAKNVELIGSEKDNFIKYLLASEFYRSNSAGQIDGGMAIILNLRDGSHDSFEYCGGDIFQISNKGNLFSIKNKELEKILLKYNVTL